MKAFWQRSLALQELLRWSVNRLEGSKSVSVDRTAAWSTGWWLHTSSTERSSYKRMAWFLLAGGSIITMHVGSRQPGGGLFLTSAIASDKASDASAASSDAANEDQIGESGGFERLKEWLQAQGMNMDSVEIKQSKVTITTD